MDQERIHELVEKVCDAYLQSLKKEGWRLVKLKYQTDLRGETNHRPLYTIEEEL